MRGFVDWIGAEADDSAPKDALELGAPLALGGRGISEDSLQRGTPWRELPVHDFPGGLNVTDDASAGRCSTGGRSS